jgi:hypothetical protein
MYTSAGLEHDLILAYANINRIPEDAVNEDGMIVFEKMAYGAKPLFHAYKDIFEMHKDDYDIFCFVTENVVIRSHGWLKKCANMLTDFRGIGFVSTQVFNGCHNQHPSHSHIKTSAWAATRDALEDIDWNFTDNPEMELADRFVAAGYFGAQVGHKIDVAFDSLENHGAFVGDSVSSLLAKQLGCGLDGRILDDKLKTIHNFLVGKLKARDDSLFVQSPFGHVGRRKVISQLQPFNGLIYDKSMHLVPDNYVERHPFNITTLASCLEVT